MGSTEKKIIELEEGWEILSSGIDKLKRLLDDKLDGKFTGDEWMRLYTYVTRVCCSVCRHPFFFVSLPVRMCVSTRAYFYSGM